MDRSKIAARIRALLSKTVENGATEGEAIAAALKARELMQQYQIGMSEAELLEEGFDGQDSSGTDPESYIIQKEMFHGIALFTHTRVWRHTRNSHHRAEQADMFNGSVKSNTTTMQHETLHFFGLKGDVMFAVWLAQTLEGFVKRGAIQYIAELQANVVGKRRASRSSWDMGLAGGKAGERLTYQEILHKRESFIVGAAKRISARLIEEWEKQSTYRPSGPGLVPVDKRSLIDEEMKRRGIVLRKGGNDRGMRAADGKAYTAGTNRGNDATFSRPVNAGNGVRAITG